MIERSLPIEIYSGSGIHAVVFSPDGKCLLTADHGGVGVWQVKDGKQTTRMATSAPVHCLALSKDGRWIAAGTFSGVVLWDAKTHEQAFTLKDYAVGLDFSPDSTRLVTASFNNERTATIWDVASRKQVQTLHHQRRVIAARYSPKGDRVATATHKSVRVWDHKDGRLLVEISVEVNPEHNNGLVWSDDHLFVVSDDTIRQFEASSGSALSSCSVPNSVGYSCVALLQHGESIAYSTSRSVIFYHTSTHTQFALIHHPQNLFFIALSPDEQTLAIAGRDGKITIRRLSRIDVGIDVPLQHVVSDGHVPSNFTFQEPVIRFNDDVLDSRMYEQLARVEAFLTESQNPNLHVLASQALVRTRLQQWDAALFDAKMAVEIKPSVIGYIAKSIALVSTGEKHKGYQACDIAFGHIHSSRINLLLLIKAIIVFMAGEHNDAISRVDDLIATVQFNSTCYAVQAYMYLLVGSSHMENSDYKGAIESFQHARYQIRHYINKRLSIISLISGWKFDNLNIKIQQHLCEALYAADRVKDAVECFRQMTNELGGETNMHDFELRSSEKLEHLGDAAFDVQRHNEAISHYSAALSLSPPAPQRIRILVKRGKTLAATGSWRGALDDANQVVTLDPSSPWGYEVKHAALHKAEDYDNAVSALETMLSKIAQSPDPDVQRCGSQYIDPSSTQAVIHKVVQRTIRHMPRVLINTITGHLHSRAEQASIFESLSVFNELVSSMTTRIDHTRIKRVVQRYFRYVMLSHKWEDNEPLFEHVIHMAVYDLEKSPTHDKLQTFCKIVRDAGFNWAWSDTCCIDKSDHFVLQEALVAMFKWYQGSTVTLVFLRGVRPSERGALARSIWNTRAWTLQEYVAAKVIRFYAEDWTLYLDLRLVNHKESPEVIAEMEKAAGVSAQQLMALRPGLTSIREKLRLASTRKTTLVEDAAYSLLGIFSVTGILAIYGEGEASLGRLLAHVLAGSGDVSILAWTGESGSFNSCLPAHITVFNGPATSHLPPSILDPEMEQIVTQLNTPSFDLDMALRLYNRLNELPAPWFAASRMKLPCIAFQLPPLSSSRTRLGRVYRANTVTFGTVEIKTRHDLSRMTSLYLIHPWLDAVLGREDVQSGAFVEDAPPSPNTIDGELFDEEIDDNPSPLPEPESLTPAHTVSLDRETHARQFVARLRQPFGALLVTPASTRGVDYRRVAADNVIMVRFQERVSLVDLLDNVCTLDIL